MCHGAPQLWVQRSRECQACLQINLLINLTLEFPQEAHLTSSLDVPQKLQENLQGQRGKRQGSWGTCLTSQGTLPLQSSVGWQMAGSAGIYYRWPCGPDRLCRRATMKA